MELDNVMKGDIMSKYHLYQYTLDYVYVQLAEEVHLFIKAINVLTTDEHRPDAVRFEPVKVSVILILSDTKEGSRDRREVWGTPDPKQWSLIHLSLSSPESELLGWVLRGWFWQCVKQMNEVNNMYQD